MDKLKIIGLLAVILLTACNSTPKSNVSNYNAKGNLESANSSGCVAINQLSNQQNPVDIFNGLNTCMNAEHYSQAAGLYFAGMSYGYFDTKRVSDKTAHQAISVLRMNVFAAQPKDVLDKLQVEIDKISSDNAGICTLLTDLGAPSYKPTYMIQHGMGAFTGQSTKDGLLENFDSVAAWKDSLTTIAKCT
jgi:hypothetical protein